MANKSKTNDDYSITMPLVVDNEQQKLGITEANKVEPKDTLYNLGSTSFYKTCFNGLNALSGAGILSVPYALSSGGWLSLILLLVIACSTLYTGLLIKRCMDIDSSIRSYPDIGERAFGAKGRALVSVSMNIELFLVATSFLIVEGDNLSNLMQYTGLKMGGFDFDGRQIFVVVVALTILPMVWLNNLSILSYISAGGVVASLVLICSILWIG
ncbi:hypothetical protein ACH5RR_029151 [Cinchona calisaya]|uniref:Amino acid transporter transmembrane domain-containing protein n=1 Tax=Cinchona calisaya TaxID=153742 RepID=A0ABD2YQU1_9GENT